MHDYNKLNIIVGHYGSGKTNIAVNLALLAKSEHPDSVVKIADLDIVNPYFRTADSDFLLREHNIDVLIPEFANTNVDIPALPPKMLTLFDGNGYSFIDVGGDDGAAVLGMYRDMINNVPHDIYYIVNMYRPLISIPSDAVECMREIEELSGLHVTKIINNSSLGEETDAAAVLDSIEYARECAALTSLPIVAHTFVQEYVKDISIPENVPLVPIHDITKKLF